MTRSLEQYEVFDSTNENSDFDEYKGGFIFFDKKLKCKQKLIDPLPTRGIYGDLDVYLVSNSYSDLANRL